MRSTDKNQMLISYSTEQMILNSCCTLLEKELVGFVSAY